MARIASPRWRAAWAGKDGRTGNNVSNSIAQVGSEYGAAPLAATAGSGVARSATHFIYGRTTHAHSALPAAGAPLKGMQAPRTSITTKPDNQRARHIAYGRTAKHEGLLEGRTSRLALLLLRSLGK